MQRLLVIIIIFSATGLVGVYIGATTNLNARAIASAVVKFSWIFPHSWSEDFGINTVVIYGFVIYGYSKIPMALLVHSAKEI